MLKIPQSYEGKVKAQTRTNFVLSIKEKDLRGSKIPDDEQRKRHRKYIFEKTHNIYKAMYCNICNLYIILFKWNGMS